MGRESESRAANREAFSARARRGEAAAREILEPALETLLEWSQPRITDRVLDLATGCGFLTRRFAPRVAWSFGVDLVMDMVLAAREVAREEGLDNVAFLSAVAESLPFRDASFDLVLTRRGPHHFANLDKALDEVHRVLKPGGLFLVEDMTVPEDPGLAEWINDFERLVSPSHGRALAPGEWQAQLEQHAFVLEQMETQDRSKALSPLLERSSPEVRDRLLARLGEIGPQDATLIGYESEGPHVKTHSILLAARR